MDQENREEVAPRPFSIYQDTEMSTLPPLPPLPTPEIRIAKLQFSAVQMQAYATAHGEAVAAALAPKGWKLVPIEPTESMLDEAWCEGSLTHRQVKEHWAVMLDAVPTPPKSETPKGQA